MLEERKKLTDWKIQNKSIREQFRLEKLARVIIVKVENERRNIIFYFSNLRALSKHI